MGLVGHAAASRRGAPLTRRVVAGIDEFVSRLPAGYAIVVGERGSALSAGERQRIALAPALLVNPGRPTELQARGGEFARLFA